MYLGIPTFHLSLVFKFRTMLGFELCIYFYFSSFIKIPADGFHLQNNKDHYRLKSLVEQHSKDKQENCWKIELLSFHDRSGPFRENCPFGQSVPSRTEENRRIVDGVIV